MDIKEFLAMVLLFILIFIGFGAMTVSYGADLDVVRDFDNTTIYHTVKSDSGSQKVSGIENNARLTTTGSGSQKTVEMENGYYEYSFLSDEDGVRLNSTDRVKFNVNHTLTANYDFTPYMFAEINVVDLHGHSGSSSTYPAMKHTGDSITKTFKPFTDVETGYTGLYILDLDTNIKYQPGDKFTITYTDVLSTGLTKMIKTFQYVYAKDIVIENIIVENKTIENITYVDKVIENITYVDKVVEIPVYVNKTVEIINYVNKTVENISYVNKTIEVPIYVNKTIENITYVNKTVEVPVYVNKTVEVINYVNKTVEVPVFVNKTIEVPFYKIIVIPEIIIDNPVIPISNNTNNDKYNETNIINYQNNNTTNLNNVTTNINKENNMGTSTLDNLKTITMKKTGNTFGLILVIILFLILIQLYRREDEK